jgi:hypothetical protein
MLILYFLFNMSNRALSCICKMYFSFFSELTRYRMTYHLVQRPEIIIRKREREREMEISYITRNFVFY